MTTNPTSPSFLPLTGDALDDATISELAPPYEWFPRVLTPNCLFNNHTDDYAQFGRDWFFSGLTIEDVIPRKGVDARDAFAHVGAVLGNWDFKHEHKEAAVAYLVCLWFKSIVTPQKTYKFASVDTLK